MAKSFVGVIGIAFFIAAILGFFGERLSQQIADRIDQAAVSISK